MSIAIIGGRSRGKHGNDSSTHGGDDSFNRRKDEDNEMAGVSMMDSLRDGGRSEAGSGAGGAKVDDVEEGDGRPPKDKLTIRDKAWLFFDDPAYSASVRIPFSPLPFLPDSLTLDTNTNMCCLARQPINLPPSNST